MTRAFLVRRCVPFVPQSPRALVLAGGAAVALASGPAAGAPAADLAPLDLAGPVLSLQVPVASGDAQAGDPSTDFAALSASTVLCALAMRALPPPSASASSSTASSQGAVRSSLPVRFMAFTSGYGLRIHPISGDLRNHDGVDIAASVGTPIIATASGVVSLAGWAGGYGLMVRLVHPGGVETLYGHMSRLNASSGQRIHQGDVIGFVGSTGNSTGPHLHYEVRISGRPVNPMTSLSAATPFAR